MTTSIKMGNVDVIVVLVQAFLVMVGLILCVLYTSQGLVRTVTG